MTPHDPAERLDRSWRLALAAAPALWLPLTLIHPFDITDVTSGDQEADWIVTHVAMLILTPLVGIVLFVMLNGITGAAATVARIATACWIAAFAAFESIAGITTGVLAGLGEPQAAERLFEHGTVGGDLSVLGFIAHPLWGVAVLSAAVALRTGGAPRPVWVGLGISALFVIGHAGPLAFIAFTALTVAAWSATSPDGSTVFEPAAATG